MPDAQRNDDEPECGAEIRAMHPLLPAGLPIFTGRVDWRRKRFDTAYPNVLGRRRKVRVVGAAKDVRSSQFTVHSSQCSACHRASTY
jgi:hypothetical protein